MKVLFDTSVLVAGLITAHPMHTEAAAWLSRAKQHEFDFVVSTHTLAELYAVLTRIPVDPPVPPASALLLIKTNIQEYAQIISLHAKDYYSAINKLVELNIGGCSIYDALIAYSAEKYNCDILLTCNTKDFKRVWPEGLKKIQSPVFTG